MNEEYLKLVYSAEDIQKILDIGRSKTYTFLHETNKTQSPFKVIRVGNLYRIPKAPFDRWINGEINNNILKKQTKCDKVLLMESHY